MEKTERFGFWLSKDEKSVIAVLAEIEGGLSQAALIRRLIHQAAMQHGITPTVSSGGDSGSAQIQENNHIVKEIDS